MNFKTEEQVAESNEWKLEREERIEDMGTQREMIIGIKKQNEIQIH